MATELQEARVRVRLDTKDALRELDKLKEEQERRRKAEAEAAGADGSAGGAGASERGQRRADDTSDARSSSPQATEGGSRPDGARNLAQMAASVVRAGPVNFFMGAAEQSVRERVTGLAETTTGIGASGGAALAGAAATLVLGNKVLRDDLAGKAAAGIRGLAGGLAGVEPFAAGNLAEEAFRRAFDPLDLAQLYRDVRGAMSAIGTAKDQLLAIAEASGALTGTVRGQELARVAPTMLVYFAKMEQEELNREAFRSRLAYRAIGDAIGREVLAPFLSGGR